MTKKKNKKHTGSKFHFGSIIFYTAIVLFIVAVIFGVKHIQGELEKYLYDYEYSLPKYTVEQIFNDYFKDPDFEFLAEKAGLEDSSEFVLKGDIISHLKNKTEGKEITYVYVAGTDKKKINVKADGEKFASFTIVQQDWKSDYGFDKYTLGEIKLFYQAQNEVKAVIPSIYSLNINGVTVGEEYTVKSEITDDIRDEIPEGTYKFFYTEYRIPKLFDDPEIKVFDANGNEMQYAKDENNCVRAEYKYDEELKTEHGEYVLAATKLYACRMQNDASFDDCKAYFEVGTKLYKNIKDNPGSFVWAHDGYSFENEEISEFYSYSENVFSCRVKFNHILHHSSLKDHPDLVDLTLYLRKGDDGIFRIYTMETN